VGTGLIGGNGQNFHKKYPFLPTKGSKKAGKGKKMQTYTKHLLSAKVGLF